MSAGAHTRWEPDIRYHYSTITQNVWVEIFWVICIFGEMFWLILFIFETFWTPKILQGSLCSEKNVRDGFRLISYLTFNGTNGNPSIQYAPNRQDRY